MQNIERLIPTLTDDGSFTFFSQAFGECFHSHYGAYQEAVGKFVAPTQLTQQAQKARLQILDVCYGLGYNTAAALETIWKINPECQIEVWALESNGAVPQAAVAQGYLQGWSTRVQDCLSRLAESHHETASGLVAQLLIGDARQTIQTVCQQKVQAEAIFLDPFSPPHCPQLWTVEFLAQVSRCLQPQGKLATYSCAAAVRSGLIAAGLQIGASPPVGRRSPGTVASFSAEGLLPLSQQEVEHLQTCAAVPYRDPTGADTAAAILQRRYFEQQTSSLEPTNGWKKRWWIDS